MARKTFSSFEEIEQELEILQLQNQLMRIKAKRSVENTLASLAPSSLLLDSLGSVGNYLRSSGKIQKFIVMWLAKRVLK